MPSFIADSFHRVQVEPDKGCTFKVVVPAIVLRQNHGLLPWIENRWIMRLHETGTVSIDMLDQETADNICSYIKRRVQGEL